MVLFFPFATRERIKLPGINVYDVNSPAVPRQDDSLLSELLQVNQCNSATQKNKVRPMSYYSTAASHLDGIWGWIAECWVTWSSSDQWINYSAFTGSQQIKLVFGLINIRWLHNELQLHPSHRGTRGTRLQEKVIADLAEGRARIH